MGVCLYVCLSICVDFNAVCQDYGHSGCLDVWMAVWMLFVRLSGYLNVCLSYCLHVWILCLCLDVWMDVWISVCLYVYPDVLVSGCHDILLDVLMSGSVDDRMSLHLCRCLSVQILGYLDICLS